MMGGWIDGYLTGVNQLSDETYDITPFQSTELIATIIDNHCQKNREHRLFTVMSSIAAQLRADRIATASELLTISVDGKTTRLYREAVRRMQVKLAAKGHYDGTPTGDFNTATLNAVEAYQESIDFSPTGFPDQATLWKLFAE